MWTPEDAKDRREALKSLGAALRLLGPGKNLGFAPSRVKSYKGIGEDRGMAAGASNYIVTRAECACS